MKLRHHIADDRLKWSGTGGPQQQRRLGQEVKWNPRTKKRQEPWGAVNFSPSHHTCLQEEMVMSPTSHLGDNGGWKKATGRKGCPGEGRGCWGAWRSSLFYLPWILCFGPSGFSTITLAGSSSCRPPILCLLPLILSQPLSHASYGCGSKTWISHLLRLLCNYLERRRRRGRIKRGSEERGLHIKSAWKRNTLHSSITLHKRNKRMKRREKWGCGRMRGHKNGVRSRRVSPRRESE